jgi:hypothetical protein
MGNGVNLRKHAMYLRMMQHPLGFTLGGLVSAAVCGYFGSAHGEIVAAVMATLGAIIGAPYGAMLAASSRQEA